ncbi:MAG: MarR family transcriptional regulator [Firmicutes bacterium]|nr:MarR family transcriptional regulator [Bacillota bacterium]
MDKKLLQSRELLIQAFGRQSNFWGMGKTAGEIFALLYFNAGPLSLEEVADGLSQTKGNVSVAVRQLEQLGMVHRSWQKGDRRVFFAAETDFMKIVYGVLALRQKQEFAQSFAMVDESLRLAEEASDSPEQRLVLARLAALQEFYTMVDETVQLILSKNPEQLQRLLKIINYIVNKF